MALANDFKLDTDEDIFIDPVTFDFVIGPSDKQHVKDILQSVPGWWKEFPLVGFNPYQYLNGKVNAQEVNKNAKLQLMNDGFNIGQDGIDIKINPNGTIEVKVLDVTRS